MNELLYSMLIPSEESHPTWDSPLSDVYGLKLSYSNNGMILPLSYLKIKSVNLVIMKKKFLNSDGHQFH